MSVLDNFMGSQVTVKKKRKSSFVIGGTCRRGHLITPENIFINNSSGARACRTCRNATTRAYCINTNRCGSCGYIRPEGTNGKTCEKCKVRLKQEYDANPEKCRARSTKHRKISRDKVLDHYGHQCVCCFESIDDFLAIDHIDGGGNKHRREIGILAGSSFYRWLIRNEFPEGFQVLCHNCNMAKSSHGTCPHEKARQDKAALAR